MRNILVATSILAAASMGTAGVAIAQGAPPARPPIVMAASSFATVEVHVASRPIAHTWYNEDTGLSGPARIAIAYGQPHPRGQQNRRGTHSRRQCVAFRLEHGDGTPHRCGHDARRPQGFARRLHPVSRAFERRVATRRRCGETAQWGTDYSPGQRPRPRADGVQRTGSEVVDALTIYLVPDSQRPATGFGQLSGERFASAGGTT